MDPKSSDKRPNKKREGEKAHRGEGNVIPEAETEVAQSKANNA